MPGVHRRYAIATTVMLTLTYGAGELKSCCACSVQPARETDSSDSSRGGSGRCDPYASGEEVQQHVPVPRCKAVCLSATTSG